MTTSIETRALLKVLGLLALAAFGFWVAALFPDVVLTLILSLCVAFALRPIVRLFELRVGMRRGAAVASTFLWIGGICMLAGFIGVPLAISGLKEMYAMFHTFPFEKKLQEAAIGMTTNIPFVDPEMVTSKVKDLVQGSGQMIAGSLSAIAAFIVNLLIIPFVTYFILAEGDSALKHLIEKVPNKYFEMTLNTLNRIWKDLVGYLRGWLLDSFFVTVLSIIGFWIVGTPYALLAGLLNGVSNLIPYVGPVAGVVPAMLFSLAKTGDFHQAGVILGVATAIQLIDNTFIQPLCFAKTVDMHPVTVIFVLIIGNEIMGVAGMLIAIPVATIFKAIAMETYWGLKNYRITA